jgi:hypothetical protein
MRTSLHHRDARHRAVYKPRAGIDPRIARARLETLPLEPYEQRLISARMPLDRIDSLGVLTQNGAKSLENAAIANGYYEKVPKHTKMLQICWLLRC